jgi:hypothetical protein
MGAAPVRWTTMGEAELRGRAFGQVNGNFAATAALAASIQPKARQS